MPTFVPGFKYDVFVSYAHVDDRKFGREAGWVETLVENLRDGLPQKLKRGQPNIWRDPRLSSNEPFSEVIREAVTQAATLLVILSESYLTSDWCQQELALFLEAANQTGGARGRIFLVRLNTLEHDSWPEAFHGLLGQKFFEQASIDAPARTLGTPAANDPGQHLYFQRLDDLCGELASKLLQMKQAVEIPVVRPNTQTSPGPQLGDGAPVVFLAETTPDLDDLRDNIRRYLNQANIRVLPDTYYDRTPQAFRTALAADLDQSLLFVQLLGLYVGPKTSDLPTGYEGLQLDIAEEKGVAILRWHDPDLNVASARDQALLTRAEIIVTAFEEFKREIVSAVQKRQAEQKLSAISGNGAYVLVNANSCDEQVTQDLLQVLDQRNIWYDTADENENIALLVERYDFHGLIVVYGHCEQLWAKLQVRACRELLLKKKQRAPVCSVYLGPPDAKPSLGIRLPNVPYVSYKDLSEITHFLLAVQAKRGEPEDMKDFFISYNKEDKNWAEWIAWILEEAGYAVVIQAWDFRPGRNFVLEMQKAATGTQKTIAILSENYLRAEYTHPEWAAAFARDPQGAKRTLIPMRVGECTPQGLLGPISYVDLVSLSEQDARIAILGAFSERGKPSQAPAFPGKSGGINQTTLDRVAPNPVQFPGVSSGADVTSSIIVAGSGNTIETAPLQPRLAPQPGISISQAARIALAQNLHAVSAQQLNILIFTLNPPAGLIPPMPAAQGDRVFALLSWAEGPGGSGLAQVQQLLDVILNPH